MELGFLRRIEFFPRKPASWNDITRLCLATKSRNLGDALVLTALVDGLTRTYPKMRLTTYPRGFNPVVFANHPSIRGLSRLPQAVYGDDCNEGGGHLIQMKERFFGLPVTKSPKPIVLLTQAEKRWAQRYLNHHCEPSRSHLPKVFLHPWGVTRREPVTLPIWDTLVRENRDRFSFWQLGMEGHSAIAGCDHYVFLKRRTWEARKLFALMPNATAFIGVDSGPMHVARAFEIRSLIIATHAPSPSGMDLDSWLQHRDQSTEPLELSFAFLYTTHRHVAATEGTEAVLESMRRFLGA